MVGLRPPKIDHLHAMRAVGDVFVRLDGQLILPSLWIAVIDEGFRCFVLVGLGWGLGSVQRGERCEQQGGEEGEDVFHGGSVFLSKV